MQQQERHLSQIRSRRDALMLLGSAGAAFAVACATAGRSPTETPATPGPSTATKTPVPMSPTTTSMTVTSGQASAKVLAATQAFIGMLDASQKTVVVADRTAANLGQWSNLPDSAFKRAGIRIDSLSAEQQKGVQAILTAALSAEGYTQVSQITTADGVLATASTGSNPGFGADRYYIRFIGSPAATGPWTVQYGGHHLAVNVTVVGSKMTLAPTLWGAQPAIYPESGVSIEPLAGETSKAYALMNALDATQQQAASLGGTTREIVLGAGQDGKTLAQEGAKASTFTDAQKRMLLDLVQEWLRPLNEENAAAKLTAAAAEIDQMTFAWSGATTVGQPIYYRVQSPTFVIEFAHQQGAGVTHIHSIYREIGNDYGAKFA